MSCVYLILSFVVSFSIYIEREGSTVKMVGQWWKEGDEKVVIRCCNDQRDRIEMECVEKSCEIGNDQTFLFTDTLGDPICRIRNTPRFTMLVNFSLHRSY